MECKVIVVSHLELRVILVAPIAAAPKQAKRLSICPDLLVFGIDLLGGHLFLVDEIVDVSAPLVKDSDVPGNPEICR
jgi:hypothetical protein